MAKRDVSVRPDTEQAAMMTGVFSRDGRHSGKVVVPVDLRSSCGGKKVIVRALGTSDYAEAKRLSLAFRLKMDAAFRAERAELKSTLQYGPAPASGYWDTMSREQFDYEMERMAYLSAEDAREPPAPEVIIPRGGTIVPWASAPALEGARPPNQTLAPAEPVH